MSLLDSFLLEDYRINVWVAARSDGIKGSGTLGDPYDGSTAARFDELMRLFATQVTATVGVRINLGPGVFQTNGYYDGIASGTGWQASARMKIVGSGIDVTTLQLVNATANKQTYAVGQALLDGVSQGVLAKKGVSPHH
jgi:hypothetical protein